MAATPPAQPYDKEAAYLAHVAQQEPEGTSTHPLEFCPCESIIRSFGAHFWTGFNQKSARWKAKGCYWGLCTRALPILKFLP